MLKSELIEENNKLKEEISYLKTLVPLKVGDIVSIGESSEIMVLVDINFETKKAGCVRVWDKDQIEVIVNIELEELVLFERVDFRKPEYL